MHSPSDPVAQFTDIKIVGVNKERTNNPNPEARIYDVYLELSDVVPTTWARAFAAAHANHMSTKKRHAYADGRYLVVQCPVEKVQEQIDELKPLIDHANMDYRRACAAYQARMAHEATLRAAEAQRRNAELDKLKFD